MKFVIGIDEAGRSPLAGPVTVAAFITDTNTRRWILKNIFEDKLRDSKKLSPELREDFYRKFCAMRRDGKVTFSSAHSSNRLIDRIGITKAVSGAISKSLNWLIESTNRQNQKRHLRLTEPKPEQIFSRKFAYFFDLPVSEILQTNIRLDGLLHAPEEFINQKTIIRGDETDLFIACASIVAKVRRDRLMRRLALKYPQYQLDIHKGYGTKMHKSLISKFGLSPIHRGTYCKFLQLHRQVE